MNLERNNRDYLSLPERFIHFRILWKPIKRNKISEYKMYRPNVWKNIKLCVINIKRR